MIYDTNLFAFESVPVFRKFELFEYFLQVWKENAKLGNKLLNDKMISEENTIGNFGLNLHDHCFGSRERNYKNLKN